MALLPSYNTGNTSSPMRNGADGASIGLALDNMIRNQLKVSDPRNPKEVADALLKYYQDLPQAAGIRNEAQGLPFLQAPPPAAMLPPAATSSDREFAIANGDVERALTDLSTNALTNDFIPELQGMAQAIRASIIEGSAAARLGLDPRQRDRVIAVRRQLGEYARLARFVGSLAPAMTQNYRRLGQALDEVAAVLLVMLGEALASVGFASGYYLLQVPFTELQSRRDAVIYALRNFMGGAQQAYGPDDWSRGINAYRLLFDRLEGHGQGDLRSLLVENEVAQTMDQLIARAQNGTPEGLRALGFTARLDIERFRRLAIVAQGVVGQYNSPPLAAFLEAIMLFSDAFKPAGGLRLLRIARPPILFYGLYNQGSSANDPLLQLVILRGSLATLLDTLFLGGGSASVSGQVLFDMMLGALDRAIDLLAVVAEGTEEDQKLPRRVVAHFLIARAIILVFLGTNWPDPLKATNQTGKTIEEQINDEFRLPDASGPNADGIALAQQLPQIRSLYGRSSSILNGPLNTVATLFDDRDLSGLQHPVQSGIEEELLVQKSLERHWRELVRTVAPEASRQQIVFNWLQIVIMESFSVIANKLTHHGRTLRLPKWDQEEVRDRGFPPQFEVSLDRIVFEEGQSG